MFLFVNAVYMLCEFSARFIKSVLYFWFYTSAWHFLTCPSKNKVPILSYLNNNNNNNNYNNNNNNNDNSRNAC